MHAGSWEPCHSAGCCILQHRLCLGRGRDGHGILHAQGARTVGWVWLLRAGSGLILVLWHQWWHLPMSSHWPFSSISRRDLDINRPGTVPNAKTLR